MWFCACLLPPCVCLPELHFSLLCVCCSYSFLEHTLSLVNGHRFCTSNKYRSSVMHDAQSMVFTMLLLVCDSVSWARRQDVIVLKNINWSNRIFYYWSKPKKWTDQLSSVTDNAAMWAKRKPKQICKHSSIDNVHKPGKINSAFVHALQKMRAILPVLVPYTTSSGSLYYQFWFLILLVLVPFTTSSSGS